MESRRVFFVAQLDSKMTLFFFEGDNWQGGIQLFSCNPKLGEDSLKSWLTSAKYITPKTNSEFTPENGGIRVFPFGMAYFQELCKFQGGYYLFGGNDIFPPPTGDYRLEGVLAGWNTSAVLVAWSQTNCTF